MGVKRLAPPGLRAAARWRAGRESCRCQPIAGPKPFAPDFEAIAAVLAGGCTPEFRADAERLWRDGDEHPQLQLL